MHSQVEHAGTNQRELSLLFEPQMSHEGSPKSNGI